MEWRERWKGACGWRGLEALASVGDGHRPRCLLFFQIRADFLVFSFSLYTNKMEDVSQIWNKVLGRNQDWKEFKPWENAERSGWLMKQGKASSTNIVHFYQVHSPSNQYMTCRRTSQVVASSLVCFEGRQNFLVQVRHPGSGMFIV